MSFHFLVYFATFASLVYSVTADASPFKLVVSSPRNPDIDGKFLHADSSQPVTDCNLPVSGCSRRPGGVFVGGSGTGTWFTVKDVHLDNSDGISENGLEPVVPALIALVGENPHYVDVKETILRVNRLHDDNFVPMYTLIVGQSSNSPSVTLQMGNGAGYPLKACRTGNVYQVYMPDKSTASEADVGKLDECLSFNITKTNESSSPAMADGRTFQA